MGATLKLLIRNFFPLCLSTVTLCPCYCDALNLRIKVSLRNDEIKTQSEPNAESYNRPPTHSSEEVLSVVIERKEAQVIARHFELKQPIKQQTLKLSSTETLSEQLRKACLNQEKKSNGGEGSPYVKKEVELLPFDDSTEGEEWRAAILNTQKPSC